MNTTHSQKHKITSTEIVIFVQVVRMRKDCEMVWKEMLEKQIFHICRIARRELYAIKMLKEHMMKDITKAEKEVHNYIGV